MEIFEDGSAKIAPADAGYAVFVTKPGYRARLPEGYSTQEMGKEDLGYFVLYEDGHESWSPSAAFEYGYTRI